MDEAARENILRAHIQTYIWQNAVAPNHTELEPTECGWYKDNDSLKHSTIPVDTPVAPDALLHLMRCNCSSDNACSSKKCGCNSRVMACTIFCAYEGGKNCMNENNKELENDNESDSDSDDDGDE